MGQDLVPVGQLDLEHRIGQRLYDGTFQFDYIVFCHYVNTLLGQFASSSPVQRASALRISLLVSRPFSSSLLRVRASHAP